MKRLFRIRRIVQQSRPMANIITNAEKISNVLEGNSQRDLNASTSSGEPVIKKPVVNTQRVNRNDPCPCGSGLKYKKCGLINAPQHKK